MDREKHLLLRNEMNTARLFLVALLFAPAALFAAAAAPKPNVLLICVDDLKPVLGAYGDTLAKTPNIDRLASRALRLDRAYCNQAVCSPSRNALLASLRPQTLGIYDLPTNFRAARPDAVTLPQYFRVHGYKTEAMGKLFHVGHGNFEDTASWTVPHFRPKAPQYALAGSQSPAEGAPKKKSAGNTTKQPNGAAVESADVPDDFYADGQIAAEAVTRLKAAAASREPFFMGVGFLKPHLPFVAPKKYWDLHDPAKLPLPARLTAPDGAPDYAPQFGGELRTYAGIPAGNAPLDDQLTRRLIHGYYAATSYMDAQLGKVMAALEETGLAKNTIVVLWGDHGWHLGDHGMWCKHTNYEEAARVPLLVAFPGRTGTATSALVETVDIYPTLAALAGLPAPQGLDGRSFAALFANPATAHRDHVIHVYPRGQRLGRALRTDRYRLVEWKAPGGDPATAEFELYDYRDDPGENKNLASARPAVVAQLRALLATHPEAKPQIKPPAAGAAAKTAAPSAAAPPAGPVQAKPDRQALFDRRDQNHDGRLSLEEFLAGQPDPAEAPKRFPTFDTNKDGFLSREEFVNSGGKGPKK
jgi:iduronate 2-sulfatase